MAGQEAALKIGRLHAITDVGDLSRALPILERGFPTQPRAFWQEGFRRIAQLRLAGHIDGPLGYVLGGGAQDAGVVLTLRSRRASEGQEVRLCNISSWYVDPSLRWYAPMMMRQVLRAEADNAITDLTASDAVAGLNTSLSFSSWSDGMIVAATLPWAALPQRRGSSVAPYEPRTRGMLDGEQQSLVEAHLELGCFAAILVSPHGASPLIFRTRTRRGLRVAELIFAECRKSLLVVLPSLMRLLLRRGIGLVTIDGTPDLCPPGAMFRRGQRRFYKGDQLAPRLDYAFSELVVLGI